MSADLRDVMKHLGERLSDIEVDDMLKEADRDNNGRVFYQGTYYYNGCGASSIIDLFSQRVRRTVDEIAAAESLHTIQYRHTI